MGTGGARSDLRDGEGAATQEPPADAVELRDVVRALRAENRRIRDLYDHAPVGCLSLDTQGQVVELNETAARMLGGSRKELTGPPLSLRVANADRPVLARHLHEVLQGVAGSCQLVFERAPGDLRFVGHLDSVVNDDPRGRRICRTALADVTALWREQGRCAARHRREQAQQQQREEAQHRFDEVVTAGAELAESLDLEATVARAARVGVPHVATYCAIDLVDAVGHVYRAALAREGHEAIDLPLDPYAPRGAASVVRSGDPVLLGAPSLGDLVSLASRPEDLPVLCAAVGSYFCTPLRAHGRTIGAMSFARRGALGFAAEDVALAQEIARHAALAIDNARLYREAQEADHRKDEFLAMLGHELRNPLAAIVFAIARLKRHPAADGMAQKTAEIVERQGTRLVRLVDDLVEVSRITRGKIELQAKRVSIGDVLRHAVESTSALLEAKRHTLTLEIAPDAIVVDADPTRLEQVFANLLTNAAKYTDPGGHIAVSAAQTNEQAIVRVRDDGIGIPVEMLTSIFAPFAQINPTLDRTDRGLGIGLALAKSLVELHGGRIEAHSAGLGMGTEMIVSLPLARGDAPGVPRAHAPDPIATRKRVLVVDDQPDLVSLLEEELTAMGHEVRVAHDGIEALEAAKAFGPELMLIDIGLPGLSGYEVAARVRGDPKLAHAKMVALTGYGGEETEGRCLEAGFDRHFTKPISEEALKGLLGG